MMSQAVGAAVPGVVGGGAAMSSASSGPQGSSAFTYGGEYHYIYMYTCKCSVSSTIDAIW